jgi:hypothetical protein
MITASANAQQRTRRPKGDEHFCGRSFSSSADENWSQVDLLFLQGNKECAYFGRHSVKCIHWLLRNVDRHEGQH